MAILDFFKKKQAREKLNRPQESKPIVEDEAVESKAVHNESSTSHGSSKIAGIILERPHITEKSANLAEAGVYVFRVAASATRRMVKRAVEELYRVRVRKVNTISTAARALRFGRHPGTRPGFRKAIITLVKGDKIEFV